jgi:hypothetical protein
MHTSKKITVVFSIDSNTYQYDVCITRLPELLLLLLQVAAAVPTLELGAAGGPIPAAAASFASEAAFAAVTSPFATI